MRKKAILVAAVVVLLVAVSADAQREQNRRDNPRREQGQQRGGQLLERMLEQADSNGDGKVTYKEAAVLIPRLNEELFDRIDANGDGFLSREDISRRTPEGQRRGPGGRGPESGPGAARPGPMFLEMLKRADADRDGEVTYNELASLLPNVTEEMFKNMDRTGDGVLTSDDAPEQDVGVDPEGQRAEGKLFELMREADADGNGKVTYEELKVVAENFPRDMFDRLDTNGDGVLSKEDRAGQSGPGGRPGQRLFDLLKRADKNQDGKVTYEEIKTVAPRMTKDVFDQLDVNGDGVLTKGDVPKPPEGGRAPRGREPQGRPKDGAEPGRRSQQSGRGELLGQADVDGDGTITFEELQSLRPGITEEMFRRMDVNGDGYLSKEDRRG